jgi:hypothetical protein
MIETAARPADRSGQAADIDPSLSGTDVGPRGLADTRPDHGLSISGNLARADVTGFSESGFAFPAGDSGGLRAGDAVYAD